MTDHEIVLLMQAEIQLKTCSNGRKAPLIEDDEYAFIARSLERYQDRRFRNASFMDRWAS